MRPDLISDDERNASDNNDKSRDAMPVLNRDSQLSPKGKKWNTDAPVLPKYEEPAQPVFSQVSRFAALGLSDEEAGASSDEEKDDTSGDKES